MEQESKNIKFAIKGDLHKYIASMPEKITSDLEKQKSGPIEFMKKCKNACIDILLAIDLVTLLICIVINLCTKRSGAFTIGLGVAVISAVITFMIFVFVYYLYCVRYNSLRSSLLLESTTCTNASDIEKLLDTYIGVANVGISTLKKYKERCGILDLFLHEDEISTVTVKGIYDNAYEVFALMKDRSNRRYITKDIEIIDVSRNFIDGYDFYILLDLDAQDFKLYYYKDKET